jgi:hypothetical protein
MLHVFVRYVKKHFPNPKGIDYSAIDSDLLYFVESLKPLLAARNPTVR